MSDHSLVRIAEGTVDHPYPHLQKEINNLRASMGSPTRLVKVTRQQQDRPRHPGHGRERILVDWYAGRRRFSDTSSRTVCSTCWNASGLINTLPEVANCASHRAGLLWPGASRPDRLHASPDSS